ncbi:unnamed protein product [Spirodela intermedia]|uniref:Uncharacterized protein n=1 Tax=Spirodela intermedia TaxID=51605 RepID=A0A7I8IE40_SPIIN|nr:unnamed protein product [Spirodela intermedia]CAA6655363.1 unnamed protein product [Spirodela intermedia]
MEGSESEAVFDTFSLKPQLFINEVLNIVDDLVDDAFDFCKEHASALVSGDGDADRSRIKFWFCVVLRSQGISSLRHMTQATLNKRLGLWERYCLLHCFSVPEGFSSAKDVGALNIDFIESTIDLSSFILVAITCSIPCLLIASEKFAWVIDQLSQSASQT